MTRGAERRAGLALAAVVAAAAAWGLSNDFVYDDVPIIVENGRVHDLGRLGEVWTSGYWPAGLMYRPLTITGFALQWAAGGGRPLLFHAISLALVVLGTLVLWRLAGHLLPPAAAWVGAAWFGVHPAHVEAVASAVGQSELLAGLFTLLGVERYLAWRAKGDLSPRQRGALALLYAGAILSKETGYVLVALILAAEVAAVEDARARGPRLRGVVPVFITLLGVALAGLGGRVLVLGGLGAEHPAEVFAGMSAGERSAAMLAVVPELVRVLLWPARLQAEYGPPGLPVTAVIGAQHLLGAAILCAACVAASWGARVRAPAIPFGLGWALLALLPVSNLFVSTGVVLAERTLYLPSAGLALAAAAAWRGVAQRAGSWRPGGPLLIAATALLLALGAARSAERATVWRDQDTFFARAVADAPTTWRAHKIRARHLVQTGRRAEAEEAYRAAVTLWEGDPTVSEELGQLLRSRGACGEALPVLGRSLSRFPERTALRARYIECALATGDTAAAEAAAREAVGRGLTEFDGTLRRLRPVPR